MDVTSVINSSSAASQSTNISALKKAESVQEQQMNGILQGLEQSNPTKTSALAAQSTGVGATLNTLA